RYVCKLKLDRLAGHGAAAGEDDLFAEDEAALRAARPQKENEARQLFYSAMSQVLNKGVWDGDRDTLEAPPEPEVWSPVAAESASCTGKHCPAFNGCTYYERRKAQVSAQVIVANHDLLLSSLGARLLPELDNCLLVLDEAHHLPATALAQFGCRMDLGRHGWVERLAQRAVRVGVRFEVTEVADVPMHAAQMRQALQETERLVMDLYGDGLKTDLAGPAGLPGRGPARARLPLGALPEVLQGPLGRVAHHASGFLDALRVIASALRTEMREQPMMARKLSTMYAQLGALAPRLEQTLDTAQLLLRDAAPDAVPAAKWFTLEVDGDQARLQAHASPLLPGATLRHHLWNKVRGAVLTSATLTSCGHFD
ncbi:MAG: ATP-dependent DNA helicase DinG, partial [Comamonadaceae bacterium]